MAAPPLSTKLHIPPPRPNMVVRSHLLENLSLGLRGKLTLVSAPAGYGKTTLLSNWVETNKLAVGWLSLDKNDNDPGRFLYYLVAALQQMDGSIGLDIQDALGASQAPAVELLMTVLINEIVAAEKRFILILDDCHHITAQSIYDVLGFLLDHIPSNLHLVLSGRVDPLLPLSRLRVGGYLAEIRSDDLRFRREEVAIFLNDLMGLDLVPGDIAALDARTEGWIAGLQLVALSLQGRSDKHEFVSAFSGSHHYIIDYLLEEVMARQPVEIRDFLARTAILDRFCVPLCDAVVGVSTSRQILQHLEETNLFLVGLDDERRWYRYHHLFADFLEQYLRDSEPAVIPDLHLRATQWYGQNGYLHEAVSHALQGQHYEEAAALVERSGLQILERSELAVLMRWVDELPQERVRSHPWLCIYHAWALRLSGAPLEAVESRLEDAELVMQDRGWLASRANRGEVTAVPEEAQRMLGHIAALRAYQALYREDHPGVIELAHRALDHRPQGSFVRSSIALALGWAYRFSGDLVAAGEAFDEAREVGLAAGNTYLAVAATCRAAHAQVLGGQLRAAVASYQEAQRIATREDGRRLPVAGYASVYLGGIYREWDELETAERYLNEGIDLCARVGYIMDQVVGYVNLARVRQAQGDWDHAQEAIMHADRLSQKMEKYVYVRRWVEDSQVRVWLAQGDLDAAVQWAEESELGVNDELNFMRELEHLILARVLVCVGRKRKDLAYLVEANALLARLLDTAMAAGWMGKAVEILVCKR